ncbi:hypothetical protein NUM3379_33910 [Kineococcus sp. NUM-3379]
MRTPRVRRLAWVSARAACGLDPDEPAALAALAAAGVAVDVVAWDDPAVDWASYDRAVLRSTWDYTDHLPAFLAWLEVVDGRTDLRNPLPVVRWSLDKHYLADLAAAGVPVVPTEFAEPGTAPLFPAGGFVVKPAVGAGSRDAASYGPAQHDAARAHVQRLHDRGLGALVQPLLASVAADGEWPLVFLAGRYSHAAHKRVDLPRAGEETGLFVPEVTGGHVATPEQVAVARAALDVVTARFGTPLYARVDLVRGDDGTPVVLELELAEPSLFLAEGGPGTAQRLAAALTAP